MSAALTPLQKFALGREVDAVVRLSQEGIDALRRLDAANDFYHLPMQLLAQGLERLLKLTLALAWLKTKGVLPSASQLRQDFGHDILALTDALLEEVETESEYVRRPAVQDDLRFIRADARLRKILRLLSTFGAGSRYYRLTEFLSPEAVRAQDDPDTAWEEIESETIARHPDWMEHLGQHQSGRVFETIARDITATLDRFTRAVTRMWTLGALHEEAGRYVGVLKNFLFLRNQELGRGRP